VGMAGAIADRKPLAAHPSSVFSTLE